MNGHRVNYRKPVREPKRMHNKRRVSRNVDFYSFRNVIMNTFVVRSCSSQVHNKITTTKTYVLKDPGFLKVNLLPGSEAVCYDGQLKGTRSAVWCIST